MTLAIILLIALWVTIAIGLLAATIDSMLEDDPKTLVLLFCAVAWIVAPIVLAVQALSSTCAAP